MGPHALRRQILIKGFKFLDLLIMAACFFAAAAVVSDLHEISFQEFLAMRIKIQNFAIFIGYCFVWHAIFSGFRLYHSRRLSAFWSITSDTVKATFLGTLVIAVSGLLLKLTMVTPVFLSIFWLLTAGVTLLSRIVLRYGLGKIRTHGRNIRHMLIVGTNARAIQLARNIEAKPALGYRIAGFVDDEYAGNGEFQKAGYTIASDFNHFPAFLRDHVVDEVMISLPVKSLYDQASKIVAACEEQGIIVRSLSDLFKLKVARPEPEDFGDETLVTAYTGAMKGGQVLVKRVFDFFLSAMLIIILSPLFLVIAILIRLTSPGPALFVQERVGLNKRRFRMYKFRTMVLDAEKRQADMEEFNEVSGPAFKIKDDPRITPVGRVLRKTSLDELLQLINVVRGDMSLVGPRPLPVRDYNGFDQDWQRRRFSVRPGITCLWQVNGRSNTSFDDWMKLDMEYIDHWSLGLDLKILIKTVPAVLRGSGAA